MVGVQEVLAERYELLELLGRGGMGVVYRAHDRVLDRVVAVKVLPLDRAQDPTAVARFEREALAAAALSDRNIVAVYDFGTDQETRFIVMEYLAGQSLAARLQQRGGLAPEEAVDVAAQVAAALAAAHAAGIVHRDIKPANVMLDGQGNVKVLDFGIARLTAGISLTQTATVLGSAPYLAPELCRGASADARSDIYALGCMLYELLTGEPPFSGELPAAVIHQQLTAAPPEPRAVVSAVPPALAALCLAMLAKDPARRPQSAAELAVRLPETLVDPADDVATSRLPVAGLGAAEAQTIPVGLGHGRGVGGAAGAEPTRVMTAGGRSEGLGRGRVVAMFGAVLAVALAIAVVALTASSGTPRHGAGAHRVSDTQTTRTQSTTTTTVPVTPTPQPKTTTQPQNPGLGGPPGHRPGGPHGGGPGGGGLPPGQAKKQGDQQGQNGQ